MPDLSLLHSLLPAVRIRAFEETVSTNRDARDWLLSGAQHGDLILAERQTQGRGRLGRSFSSPEGGLYMTLILRMPPSPGPVTTLCAVAVCRVLEKLTSFQPRIKWVNDVLVENKKVCGILCEGVWQGNEPLGMVVGIGLNVFGDALPDDLKPIARALYPNCTCPPVSRERFAAAIYDEIMHALPQIPDHIPAYRARCLTLGREITWTENNIQRSGTALDIDHDGALIIRLPNGTQHTLSFGEVSVRAI